MFNGSVGQWVTCTDPMTHLSPPYLLTHFTHDPLGQLWRRLSNCWLIVHRDELAMAELERSRLRREYDLLVSELTSVLHVDEETVTSNTLKHKVTDRHILCEFQTLLA